jgi:Dynamin family
MSTLQNKVIEYQIWRDSLKKAISDYRDWLSKSSISDSVFELRLYDLLQTLSRDQLIAAMLAEFSRGKTETINAIFFADFSQRLLPSEPGRTTMCPSEIFWDDNEEPCIKLLPIETRRTNDTINFLKSTPNAWQKFRLNTESPAEMKETLRMLVAQQEVTQQEAEALGLWSTDDISMLQDLEKTGKVNIPVWRHALINYPHPLLKTGLVIIDTPGLNSLGAEPELTLSIIPNAHAVLFLTAVDSGITKSDIQIWNDYVKGRAKTTLVLLNKIDMLWDDLKPQSLITEEVAKQVGVTARQLHISADSVFPISAQKALVAKIKHNPELLARSGIQALENVLGTKMIDAKHSIIGKTIAIECGQMVKSSRQLLQLQINQLRAQTEELKKLRGQSASVFNQTLASVTDEKKRYDSLVPLYNHGNEKISHIGERLLRHLSQEHLESTLSKNQQELDDSWTTMTLNRRMRETTAQANKLAENISKEAKSIRKLAVNVYDVFRVQHGFDVKNPPELDITEFTRNMSALQQVTDDFCKDPINMLTEKRFLIRKFSLALGSQKQKIFEETENMCKLWLAQVLSTLKAQMDVHKTNLDQRIANLMKAKNNAQSLDQQIRSIEQEISNISTQTRMLDETLLLLLKAAKSGANAEEANLGLTSQPLIASVMPALKPLSH